MVGIGAPLVKRTAVVPIWSSVKGDTRSGMVLVLSSRCGRREAYYTDRSDGLSIKPMKVDLLDMRGYNCVNVRPSRLEDFWYDRSREGTVGNKLYVGSLSYQVTDQTLQELFAQHGTVTSAKVSSDRYTGQSRGLGFVEMATSG